jgi:hypothetical protein
MSPVQRPSSRRGRCGSALTAQCRGSRSGARGIRIETFEESVVKANTHLNDLLVQPARSACRCWFLVSPFIAGQNDCFRLTHHKFVGRAKTQRPASQPDDALENDD